MMLPLSAGRVHVIRAALTAALVLTERGGPGALGAPALNLRATVAADAVWRVTVMRTRCGVVQLLPVGRWASAKSSNPTVEPGAASSRWVRPSAAWYRICTPAGPASIRRSVPVRVRYSSQYVDPPARSRIALIPRPFVSYGASATVRVEVTVTNRDSQPSWLL